MTARLPGELPKVKRQDGPKCEKAAMQAIDEVVRSVVSQVLTRMRNGALPLSNGKKEGSKRGVFNDVDSAVAAAREAQRAFAARGLEERRKAIACIRRICSQQA